jgi:uncharacterized membrane-anchored protein YhcB (DUF1043 family)
METATEPSYTLLIAIVGMVIGNVVHQLRWLYKATRLDDSVEKELDLLTENLMRLYAEDNLPHVRVCAQLILSMTVRSLASGLHSSRHEEEFRTILHGAIHLLQRPLR